MIEADTVDAPRHGARDRVRARAVRALRDATGDAEFKDVVRAQAAKRVAMQFVTRRIASWDHRKLGGVY